MWKDFQDSCVKRLKQSLKKIPRRSYDLPLDYVVYKFYELGYKVTYNKYSKIYRSCCPLCREGKSWGRKQRCYYIPENDNIFCHNCGSSLRPFDWIKEASGMTDDEIFSEVEANNTSFDVDSFYFEKKEKKVLPSLPEDSINLFDETQINFYKDNEAVQKALKVIEERKLRDAINAPDALFISLKDFWHKNRLIIPFKDTNGKIIFYQSRKLLDSDEKDSYISKFDADKSLSGMDRINSSLDYVFLFEGPIDAFFVKNGVGLGGINKGYFKFTPVQEAQLEELKFFSRIWVLDSQWIDETSREKTLKLLEQGECVFLWPKKLGILYKDFNEMCVDLDINGVSQKFVKDNAFCGKEGVLKYRMMFGKL